MCDDARTAERRREQSRPAALLLWRALPGVAVLAVLGLQVAILLRPVAPASSTGTAAAAPVLVDDRGRPVYPYMLREVQNTITKNAAALQQCYVDYLNRSPQVWDGKMTFDWYVTPEGKAEQVEFVGGALGDDRMKAAVSAAVGRMRFPPPGARTYVEYTFNFKDVTQGTEKQ